MNEEKKNENNGTEEESRARQYMVWLLAAFAIVALVAGLLYLDVTSKRVYVEKSEINAVETILSSRTGGTLDEIYVNTGDSVPADEIVARLGGELVKTKDAGLVISRQDAVGKFFAPGEAIVTMIRPQDLRVVGRVEEDKGLQDIRVGQEVIFKADAFGTKQYKGIIDEVSPTSRPSDVVFNISDQRQEQEFNVKARFNLDEYPELKNGMSAKMWIYK
jgi:multidrug resistance efflux pump